MCTAVAKLIHNFNHADHLLNLFLRIFRCPDGLTGDVCDTPVLDSVDAVVPVSSHHISKRFLRRIPLYVVSSVALLLGLVALAVIFAIYRTKHVSIRNSKTLNITQH